MFIVKMADHDGNHRCLVEKNVPTTLILPSRWRDGADSLPRDRALAVYGIRLMLPIVPQLRPESNIYSNRGRQKQFLLSKMSDKKRNKS